MEVNAEAARRLRLSPSVVTRSVAQLEDRLGLTLLNRTTRRISLTDDGAVYHQRALALVQDIDELEGVLRRAATKPVGGCGWMRRRR